jgi:L-fuculose-phosphate aldolase/L-ribulose-5-phosphate 4-epimerase
VEDPEFPTLPPQVMDDGYAVLLGNHGPITVGKTLEHALERAVTLEEAARTFFIAKSIGAAAVLTEEQARASFDYYHNRYGQKQV